MKRSPAAVLAFAAAIGCGPAPRPGSRAVAGSVRVGDVVRTYRLYAPGRARVSVSLPLMLVFHGTGESGAAIERESGLDEVADRRRLLVAYLDAAVGNWAEDCGCSRADQLGVNDTGFVRVIVSDVARRHPVDLARVYAVGFSQGGLFVQRLACQMADVFAGVASISAPMSAPLAERCDPTRPVRVMVLMGTLDGAYPYEGQRRAERSTLGARETAEVWRVLDGCGRDPAGRELPNRAADGTRVLEERWTGCRRGVEVALYTVDGGQHAWSPSADVSTDEVLVEFLLRQGQ